MGGPTRIYVYPAKVLRNCDGEKTPSTFGTGTEDYFGYAWETPTAFDSALQAQPRNGASDKFGMAVDRAGPGNIGHITMVRWQIPDNVPFQKSFEATVEKYHPNEWPLLNAYTASWYQSPGTSDHYRAVPASERTGYYVAPTPKEPEPRVEGKYEGESLEVLKIDAGTTLLQNMGGFRDGSWSGNEQLLWIEGGQGDSAEFEFTTAEGGAREVLVVLTKARDYGIVQLSIDGKNLGEPIDCYDPTVTTTDEISLGALELKPGKHVLGATLTGANDQAKNAVGVGNHLFGLDYLRLRKPSSPQTAGNPARQ